MKALVGAFNQEKALVGAFSVIVQLHRLIDLRHYLEPCHRQSEQVPASALSLKGPEHVFTRGEAKALPLGVVLTHVFNHQTHHRGQATHILRQLGVAEPPSLDLLYFALPTA